MPKFRFAGDPNDNWSGPKEIAAYGLTFTRDEWTDVPPELASKFSGNAHFEPEDGGEPPAHVKRRGGWPLGKPRKPKVETQQPQHPQQEGDGEGE